MLLPTQNGVNVCPVLLLTLFHPTHVVNGVEYGEKRNERGASPQSLL